MRQNSYRWGAFFTLLRAKSPLLQPIVILWGLGGSGALVVFWSILGGWTNKWSILAQQGGPLAWEPRFYTGATLAHFWRTPQAAHRLYWRTSGAHPKSPIAYIRATLAHIPSRPSPILGRFWRTCCFLTSMQTWSTTLWSSPSMPSCTC